MGRSTIDLVGISVDENFGVEKKSTKVIDIMTLAVMYLNA